MNSAPYDENTGNSGRAKALSYRTKKRIVFHHSERKFLLYGIDLLLLNAVLILTLYLQGACTGCPSSTITLKQGIESHLKEAVPELKEVIQL